MLSFSWDSKLLFRILACRSWRDFQMFRKGKPSRTFLDCGKGPIFCSMNCNTNAVIPSDIHLTSNKHSFQPHTQSESYQVILKGSKCSSHDGEWAKWGLKVWLTDRKSMQWCSTFTGWECGRVEDPGRFKRGCFVLHVLINWLHGKNWRVLFFSNHIRGGCIKYKKNFKKLLCVTRNWCLLIQ